MPAGTPVENIPVGCEVNAGYSASVSVEQTGVMMQNTESTTSAFSGFDQMQHHLWAYEARVQVWLGLTTTPFFANEHAAAAHVNHSAKAGRIELQIFDANGARLASDTIYDDTDRGMPMVEDFRLPDTIATVPFGSDLDRVGLDGWIVDLERLRAYDLDKDRDSVQRAVFLGLLPTMIANNEVRAAA